MIRYTLIITMSDTKSCNYFLPLTVSRILDLLEVACITIMQAAKTYFSAEINCTLQV